MFSKKQWKEIKLKLENKIIYIYIYLTLEIDLVETKGNDLEREELKDKMCILLETILIREEENKGGREK